MNAKNDYHQKLLLYEKLIDTHPDIEVKGKTMPYTSVNGHMFSILDKEGHLGLRLPAEVRQKFLKEHHTQLHVAYGSVMKEYVRVPNSLLSDTEALEPYLNISFNFVKSLKPK